MLAGLSKKKEGPASPGDPPASGETTIKPHPFQLALGVPLAAIVLAGAAAATETPPPASVPAPAGCQPRGKSGVPHQTCLETPAFDAAAGRRQRLNAEAQRDCRILESAILESEQAEQRMRAAMIESVQQDLLILRKRYRRLGC
ncbi:hypothetical protein [uncultured Massilia sp.]|uniref:hypothetical protein n=1 Tax=uncultured Massilia sp. TaxID=169973 RepID=UPI00258A75D7|nr:hypothetical protein [uncultured Massilia sp.]